ncbi:MAG: hypothetical protein OEW12_07085 [Deltaproteobacteria bacterium]|nr:hypothetical protein [Deltaproteobacteria bacterium]
MFVFLVTFALETPEDNMKTLVEMIQSQGDWGRISNVAYALHTPLSQQNLFESLAPVLKEEDVLYVVPLRRPFVGKGPAELDKWLDEVLPY